MEWAYCFDVHLNAFIPLSLLVYGLQVLLWPRKSQNLLSFKYVFKCFFLVVVLYIVMSSPESILSVMFTNTLWLMGLCHYLYMTFLGYTVLPSMSGTTILLSCTIPLALLYIVSIPCYWNAAYITGTFLAARCGV